MASDSLPLSVAREFAQGAELLEAQPISAGHIHDTYLARYKLRTGGEFRLVHQRMNSHVFSEPETVMRNVLRVTEHLRAKLQARGESDLERRCLRVVLGRAGEPLYRDETAEPWRTLVAIDNARSVDRVESAEQAFEAARAFGEFTLCLDDLPPPPLTETIPHFHDLKRRFSVLEAAVKSDRCARASEVGDDVERATSGYAWLQERLEGSGFSSLPVRNVHHDCKVNNVMLDEGTGRGLCVIDLDTVMPGRILSDFGELVRTATVRASEDAADPQVDLDLFAAVSRGYLQGLEGLLHQSETRLLPVAGPMFALMNSIRFLTDYLEGDLYFRPERPSQNLDRTRAQFQLFERFRELQDELTGLLEEAAD